MPDNSREETIHITARVPRELARDFERVAQYEDRSVSAELRRVMRRRVAEHRGAVHGRVRPAGGAA